MPRRPSFSSFSEAGQHLRAQGALSSDGDGDQPPTEAPTDAAAEAAKYVATEPVTEAVPQTVELRGWFPGRGLEDDIKDFFRLKRAGADQADHPQHEQFTRFQYVHDTNPDVVERMRHFGRLPKEVSTEPRAVTEQPVQPEPAETPSARLPIGDSKTDEPGRQTVDEYLRGLTNEEILTEIERTRAHRKLGHREAHRSLRPMFAELERRGVKPSTAEPGPSKPREVALPSKEEAALEEAGLNRTRVREGTAESREAAAQAIERILERIQRLQIEEEQGKISERDARWLKRIGPKAEGLQTNLEQLRASAPAPAAAVVADARPAELAREDDALRSAPEAVIPAAEPAGETPVTAGDGAHLKTALEAAEERLRQSAADAEAADLEAQIARAENEGMVPRPPGSSEAKPPAPGKPEAPATPKSPKDKRRAAVVDVTGMAETIARHRAEERLQAELRGESPEGKRLGWFGRLRQKFSRHAGEEGYRQRYIAAEKAKLLKELEGVDPNLFTPDEKTSAAFRQEKQAIIDRFLADYDQAVRANEGERREALADASTKTSIKELMARRANGEIDDATFVGEKDQILQAVRAAHPDIYERERATIDNLLEVAKDLQTSLQHGDKIAAMDIDLDIQLGRHRSAVKSEANLRAFDRLVKQVQKVPVLNKIFTPVVLGFTASLATVPLRSMASLLARTHGLGAPVAGAVVGGGYAALRRSMEVKGDITHVRRATTMGYEVPKGARRLEKMKEFVYDQASVGQLSSTIAAELRGAQDASLSQAERQAHRAKLVELIAGAEARLDLGTTLKKDLLRYEDPTTIERQRLELTRSLAEAKVGLRQSDPTIDAALRDRQQQAATELQSGIEKVDRRFGRFKNLEMARAAVYGATTGFIAGSFAQIGVNWFREHVLHQTDVPHSALEKMFGKITGHDIKDYDTTPGDTHVLGSVIRMNTPHGYDIHEVPGKPGFVEMVDPHGKVITEPFQPDLVHKTIPESVRTELLHNGWRIDERDVTQFLGEKKSLTPMEWMAGFAKGTKHIARDAWYDNNTPKVFDLNELKLHWGGVHGSGLDEHGNYVFNVFKMKPDGSFHGDLSADAQKLIGQGDMRIMLSLSRETQKMVYEATVDAQGNAVIDPHSEAGQLLFKTVSGKAHFLGRFAEASQLLRDEHGALALNAKGEQIVRELATYEGHGLSGIGLDKIKDVDHVYDLLRPKDWELPPVIPLSKRKPLEAMQRKPKETIPPYYYGGDLWGEEKRQEFLRHRSETLRKNPDAQLDEQAEVRTYLDRLDPAYREEIERLDAQINDPMEEGARLTVIMPAYQEVKNIRKTLEQYALQQTVDGKRLDPKQFEVIVFVNRPDDVPDDGTMKEIESFRSQYPQVRVRAIEQTFPRERVNIGRFRKMVADLALVRSMKRTKRADGRLILVSNDADAERIAPTYVDRTIRDFDQNQNLDAIAGKLDFAPGEAYEQYPLFHATQRLFQYIFTEIRHRATGGTPHTPGNNSAFTAEMYAGIGGYNEYSPVGEDVEIGAMIQQAREGTGRRPIRYENRTEIIVNPRRHILKMREGTPLAHMYGDWATDEETRKRDWQASLAAGDDPSKFDVKQFEREATYARKWITGSGFIGQKESFHNAEEIFRRAMDHVGVKFEIRDDQVVVTDAERLLEGLRTYPERHRAASAAKERRRRVNPKRQRASDSVTIEEAVVPPGVPSDERRGTETSGTTGAAPATPKEIKRVDTTPAEKPDASVGTPGLPLSATPGTTETAPAAPKKEIKWVDKTPAEKSETPVPVEAKPEAVDPKVLRAALIKQGIPDQWIPHDDRELIQAYHDLRKDGGSRDPKVIRHVLRSRFSAPAMLLGMMNDADLLARVAAVEKAVKSGHVADAEPKPGAARRVTESPVETTELPTRPVRRGRARGGAAERKAVKTSAE